MRRSRGNPPWQVERTPANRTPLCDAMVVRISSGRAILIILICTGAAHGACVERCGQTSQDTQERCWWVFVAPLQEAVLVVCDRVSMMSLHDQQAEDYCKTSGHHTIRVGGVPPSVAAKSPVPSSSRHAGLVCVCVAGAIMRGRRDATELLAAEPRTAPSPSPSRRPGGPRCPGAETRSSAGPGPPSRGGHVLVLLPAPL